MKIKILVISIILLLHTSCSINFKNNFERFIMRNKGNSVLYLQDFNKIDCDKILITSIGEYSVNELNKYYDVELTSESTLGHNIYWIKDNEEVYQKTLYFNISDVVRDEVRFNLDEDVLIIDIEDSYFYVETSINNKYTIITLRHKNKN